MKFEKTLKSWIIAEKQARKESSLLCTVMQELADLVHNIKNTSAGEKAYSVYIRLIDAQFALPSIHCYVDRVSLKFNANVGIDVKPKCLEVVYAETGVARFDTLEDILDDTKFLEAISSKDCERLTPEGYARLNGLIADYIYKGQLFKCSTGELSIHLDKDQLDTETFDNLLMVLAGLHDKYPKGLHSINGNTTQPVELILTPAAPCYYFYNGLISFSVEIEHGLVKFKDYQGALELDQSQICEYYNQMYKMLKLAYD